MDEGRRVGAGGRMIGRTAEPGLVPTQLAALAAGVSEATIRKWASRAKISRYGRPGRAEYDIGELIEIVAARHGRRITRDVQAVRAAENEAVDDDEAVGPQGPADRR